MIERWQGRADAADGDFPEEWVASTVRARNAGREHRIEGYSRVERRAAAEGRGSGGVAEEGREGGVPALRDLIAAAPEAFLGRRHASVYGDNPGVLVKVLDAAERLTIQVHPSPAFARERFGSPFGKTEAWYVVGGREIDGEAPYVLFGFKPGVTAASWRKLFETQNIPGMIDALHRVPVREGDVFLIEGGVPHAIGPGCFLIEIQEPTDLTLRTERTTPSGLSVPDAACHQGIGFEAMLECFSYEALEFEEAMRRWRKAPRTLEQSSSGFRLELIGEEDTSRFRMERFLVQPGGKLPIGLQDAFAVAIVLSGSGAFVVDEAAYETSASDQWFLPAGLAKAGGFAVAADGGGAPLDVVVCRPPVA